jgi:hypothetical protein
MVPSQGVSRTETPPQGKAPAIPRTSNLMFRSCVRRSLKSANKPSLFPFHHVIASLPQPIIISAEQHPHSWSNETDLLTTDRPMSNPSDYIVSSDPRKRLSRSHQLLKSRKPHPKAEPCLRDSPSPPCKSHLPHIGNYRYHHHHQHHPLRASKT